MMSSLVSGLISHVRHRVLEYGRDGEKVSAPYAYYIDAYNGLGRRPVVVQSFKFLTVVEITRFSF